MQEKHTVLLFMKFGSKENIEDLFNNGTIYMNPLQKFRELEDEELRGDSYEGVSSILNIPAGDIEIPSLNFKGKYHSLHLRGSREKITGNVFCLYCISSYGFNNPEDIKVDEKVKLFGSHVLFIKDKQEFLNRVENKLKSLNLKYNYNFVEYYDKDKINGTVHLFQKPLEFEYQKEFRFYVEKDEIEPISFSIGSLENIAEIHEIQTIDTLVVR